MAKKNKRRKLKKIPLLILFALIIVVIIIVFGNNKESISKEQPSQNKEDIKINEDSKKKMSIAMVGDALIHGSVYNDASVGNNNYDFSSMFADIKPMLADYDLKYYNQETIIGGKNLGLSNYPTFNSPDEIGEDLVKTGFNLVSLANNHTLDKGETGILYSNQFWNKQKDVITAGSYSSWDERNNIPIYEQNGIKYAFLSYTTTTNGLSSPTGKEYLLNVYSEETVKEDIDKIKDKVDVIIVAMHWGVEYTHTPVESQKEIAKYLSSLGVDLIIGSHPHVIEPIDYIGDTLVIYSLGNFISGQKVLGIEKIIGLFVGVDIVVEEDKVSFENLNSELLYTYSTDSMTDFKVIPFSKLNNNLLPNYKDIQTEYEAIVNETVDYD